MTRRRIGAIVAGPFAGFDMGSMMSGSMMGPGTSFGPGVRSGPVASSMPGSQHDLHHPTASPGGSN